MLPLRSFLAELRRTCGREVDDVEITSLASELERQLREPHVAFLLRGLATVSNETTLGRVFEHPLAQRRFGERLADRDQLGLVVALERWARKHARTFKKKRAEEQRAERERLEREKASAEDELANWAAELGVTERLRDPVSRIAPFLAAEAWYRDHVAHFLSGTVQKAALGELRLGAMPPESLRTAARAYLERCAAIARRDRERAARHGAPTGSPALDRICGALRDVDAKLTKLGDAEAVLADDAIFLDPEDLRVIASDARTGTVALDLAGHELGRIALDPPSVRAGVALALVRWTLDAIHDERHEAHAELRAILNEPGWRRLARGLERAIEGGRDEGSPQPTRLRVRVSAAADGEPHLEIVLQRESAGGRWSKGARATPRDVLDASGLEPAFRIAAVHLFTDPGSAGEVLHALAGAGPECADVVVDETGAPLAIRRVEARFALVEAPEGAVPAIALGDARLAPADFLRRARGRTLAHVVEERREILVARVDRDLLRVAAGAAAHPAPFPADAEPEIVPLIERLAARVPVELPREMEEKIATVEPALFVRIEPAEREGAEVELRARISPSISAPAGRGSALVSVIAEGEAKPVLRRRDLEAELTRAHDLARTLALPGAATRATLESDDALLELLAALHARPEVEVEWPAQRKVRYVGALSRSKLALRVREAAQWFGVEGTIEIDGQKIELAQLLAEVRAGRRFVRVGPGRFAAIEADLRARLERAADVVFRAEDGSLAITATAGDALEALADDDALRADAAWVRLRARLREGVATPRVPKALRAELRGYQRDGFAWLARLASLEAGAVLADDMGLGKTIQALALLVQRARSGPSLVVAPTSLVDNWAREAARFAPSLRVRVHRGTGRHDALAREPLRAGEVLVASYDVVALDVDALGAIELGTLILDEAQAIKNPDAQRTRAVRRLRAGARVALTGTPLENRLSELWSIVSVVHPGLLGPWPHFRARFAIPIERDGDTRQLAALSALVRPYLLRRTKEVVAPELPPRTEVVREVELSEPERRLYEAERADAIAKLATASEDERFQVLASITRLRQLACDPSLVVPDAGARSSKLDALTELVEELHAAGRKVLVFSQFVRLLERASARLAERGVTHLMLDGSTPAAERARLVERFQAGEATAFLLSLKAGGTGLNLTAADHVVHVDPWWNPAVEDQASDRTHRIGQDKPVTIVKLVAGDTIEQAVLALHEDKRALTRGVLEGADLAGSLSARELVALIRGTDAASGEPAAARRRASRRRAAGPDGPRVDGG